MGFLQSPDPARKLARQYGIRGLFSPEIVPSLQPVTLIDDLSGGISNEPQKTSVVMGVQVAVAAEFSLMRFETPPNVIAHITSLYVKPGTSDVIDVHFGSSVAAPAVLATSVYTDGRLRNRGQSPASRLGFDTYAVAPTTIHYRLPGNNSSSVNPLIPVNWIVGDTGSNFDFVEIWCHTVNISFTFGMFFTEYDAIEVR